MAVRISLTMIVKNEAAALPACLEAARPWVDEIVVVDTGSTDATRDVARHYGARVFEFAWCDDFAAARNESLRHATGDWILTLDADETLTPDSGPALRRACEDAGDVAGYDIKIVCPREGDGGLVRLNWFPRLFRNLPGVRWHGVIHEQVVESLAAHGRLGRAPVEVMHSGYTLAPAQMMAKARRNTALLERQLREEPDYAPGWFQLAETYVLIGRLDDAIAAYRRCLRLLEVSRLTLGTGVIAIALQNLGAALLQRGDREEGLEMIQAALLVDPEMAPAYVHLGNAALARQAWDEAEAHFAHAIAIADGQAASGEYQISPWLIHFLRGCARGRQHKVTEAIESFEAALALNPRHADSLWLLALTQATSGQWAPSLDTLERLAALGRDDFPFHAQRAQGLLALGRAADAAVAAERALAAAPDEGAAQALAAECLGRAGRHADAAAVYGRIAAAHPEAAGPLLAMAHCHEMAGDRTAMMAAYQRAVALAPDSPEVLFALGSACLRAGALAEAEECLAAAVARQPDRAELRLNHALCLLKKGAVDEAAAAVATILERWPTLKQARELSDLLTRLAAAPLAGAGSPA